MELNVVLISVYCTKGQLVELGIKKMMNIMI